MRPETQAEFKAYVATDAGMSYIAGAEFEARCQRLFERFNAGEELSVADAAEFIGLPVDVFRFLFAHYLALMSIVMGEPTTRSAH